MRSKKHRTVLFRDVATLYGERPRDERVWYLSPYEFITDWEVQLLSCPQSYQDQNHKRHHAVFTEACKQQIKANTQDDQDSELLPGIDYCVKTSPDSSWLPLLKLHLPSISVIRGSLRNASFRLLLYS